MHVPARTRNARRGTTVVELVVSTALLVLVLGFGSFIGSTTRGAYVAASSQTAQELQATRALRRLAAELAQAGVDTLFPPPDPQLGSGEIAFQCAGGVEDGEVAWGPLTRVRLEYEPGEIDDGLDQDGDGLVDECRVVLVRDEGSATEQTLVVCRNVTELLEGEFGNGDDDNGNGLIDESGFCITQDGDALTLRLSLAATNTVGVSNVSTHELTVKLWN